MCLLRILRWVSSIVAGFLIIVTILAYILGFEEKKVILIGAVVATVAAIILTLLDAKINGD